MYRILKPTGSIFLHCDWHASHYIKSQILDDNLLFGRNNFRNEIIWGYKKWAASKNQFCQNHDTIFWYSKSSKYIFNQLYTERAESTLKRFGKKKIISGAKDEYGKRIPSITSEDDSIGVKMGDWWEIPIIAPSGRERIGYPTQKPEELLQRIIECSTNEGDVVLDPFVGGGTTIAVANRLNRKWIGIDQSVMAIKVTDLRLKKRQNELFAKPYDVIIPTYDLSKIEKEDGKNFEIFIVEKFGGIPNLKGGKDYGIDGHTDYGTPIQVKKWKKPVGRDTLDSFLTAIVRDDKKLFERNKKEGQICGFIIGFEFSKDLINEVARLKNNENTIIELKYIRDIIPYENPPKVKLTAEELENLKYRLEARTESKTGIDFYAWDLSHNEEEFIADVVMDKTGIQEKTFAEGEHKIAVQAIDKKGLSGTDKLKIKVKKK
jgi:DNA modification methylase